MTIFRGLWVVVGIIATLAIIIFAVVAYSGVGVPDQSVSTTPVSQDRTTGLATTGESEAIATPILTPTSQQTPATVPKTPVLRLRYDGSVYEGERGSGCWPTMWPDGSVNKICWDAELLDPHDVIAVAAGGTLTIVVEADEEPLTLGANIFKSVEEPPIRQLTFTPSLGATFTVDFPAAVYIIHIHSAWADGDIYYAFKLKVG